MYLEGKKLYSGWMMVGSPLPSKKCYVSQQTVSGLDPQLTVALKDLAERNPNHTRIILSRCHYSLAEPT